MSYLFSMVSPVALLGMLAAIALVVLVFTGYQKAPPDTAFIISGLRKRSSSAAPV